MAGLRERKKQATRAAIHDAAMELFAAQGFAATTVDQIAERADLSRATVFTHFPTKEDIVWGDAPQAVEALAAALDEAEHGTLPAVRDWLRRLTGWIEPELVVQLRLAREVPAVGARRLQVLSAIEGVIARALQRELSAGHQLSATLAAGSLIAALRVVEETAAARMEQDGRALADAEVDALLDDALAFAEGGTAALRARGR